MDSEQRVNPIGDRRTHRMAPPGGGVAPPPEGDTRADAAPEPLKARQLWREPSVTAEFWSVALWVGGGTLAGAMFGHPALGALLALGLVAFRWFRYLVLLRGWAHHPRRVRVPDLVGLWGEIFERLVERNEKSRRRKRQLVRIVEEFQASTAVLPDGAVVMTERGEIAWFNASAQALLGLRFPQDSGLRVTTLVRNPAFTRYFEAGDVSAADVEMPSPVNPDVSVALKIIPYGNSQKLLIVRDVSERKRLEQMRRDFVANVSHELRTPLTVLLGYLEMLEPEVQKEAALAAWKEPIAEMRREARRMESLIGDLLGLARLESDLAAKPEVLDVPQLIRRTLDSVRNASKQQHNFEVDLQPGLRLVGREGELQSVFSNLLQNAVQYTAAGGSIRVRWREEPAGGVLFSVADSGIGIRARDIPRLTERFYRVDVARSRATGGTGLGLSIVKHSLDRHEARLEVESEPGVGSTFTCHFPAHRVVRAPVAKKPNQTVP